MARCSTLACGLDIPREGQVSGPVNGRTPGDPASRPVGVFLLDDEEIVRTGVRGLLEAEPGIRVMGDAGTHRLQWPRSPRRRSPT